LQLRSQIDDEPGVLDRVRGGVGFSGAVTKSSLGLTDAVLRFENYFRRDEIECVPKALWKACVQLPDRMSSPNSIAGSARSRIIARFTTIQFWTFLPVSIHPPLNKCGGQSPRT